MVRHVLTLLAVLLCLVAPLPPAAAESRIALVIGNDRYQYRPSELTAVNDAQAIGAMLSSAGFAVISASNLTLADMRERARQFAAAFAASGPDTVALVFFAGAGAQVDGESYLLPVDARPENPSTLRVEALALKELLPALTPAQGRMLIVILAASRGNPFATWRNPTSGRGLAIIDAPLNTIVAYATAPGGRRFRATGRPASIRWRSWKSCRSPGLGSSRDSRKCGRASTSSRAGVKFPGKARQRRATSRSSPRAERPSQLNRAAAFLASLGA